MLRRGVSPQLYCTVLGILGQCGHSCHSCLGPRYVWSGVCAERRCATPTPNSSVALAHRRRLGDVDGRFCAHNGSCWVFPPRLSRRSAWMGPVQAAAVVTNVGDLIGLGTRGQEQERAVLYDHQEEMNRVLSDEMVVFDSGAVQECDCPLGWWGTRCRRLDLCVMRDVSNRLPRSEPRCRHGEADLTPQTQGCHS